MTPLFQVPIHQTRIIPSEEDRTNLDELLYSMFEQMPENSWAMETGKSTGSHTLQLHFFPQMKWLLDAMHGEVRQFWQDLNYRKDAELGIIASWANLHRYSQLTGVHSHCGGAEQSHISAVFYFKKPEGSGHIEFVDPLEYINQMVPIQHYSEHDVYKAVPAEQYDLILFPSWIRHRTQPNMSHDDRIAISINFVGHWQL